MNLGLLDLPAPLLDAVDDALYWLGLPPALRIALYAIPGAIVSMLVYGRASNQTRLAQLRAQIRELQQRLLAGSDDYAQTQALVRRNLALSFEQLRLTLIPALLASVPLLFFLPWLSNRFDFAAASRLVVCAQPAAAANSLHWQPASAAMAQADGCWRVALEAAEDLVLKDGDTAVFALPHGVRSNAITGWGLFNLLVANPAGYLPAGAPVDRVTMVWPDLQVLGFGPAWMRGWSALYFVVLLLTSLYLRWHWRLR